MIASREHIKWMGCNRRLFVARQIVRDPWGESMHRVSIFRYYSFGYNYNNLRWNSEGFPVHDDDSLISRSDEFFAFCDELDLPVTKKAATRLTQIRREVEKLPKGTKVDEPLARRVTSTVNELDRTLDAELALRTAYVLTPKRLDSPSP